MRDEDEDPKQPRFSWPPTKLPATELNAPAKPMEAGARHRLSSRSSRLDDDRAFEASEADELAIDDLDWSEPEFVPPEAEDTDPVEAEPREASPHSPVRGLARWIEAFEIAYLGRVSASWDVRARDAGWLADEDGDFCPRCGVTVGEYELDTLSDPATCARCRDKKLAWDRFLRLGAYEGVLAGAIRELKFHAIRAHGERLGALLGERVHAELARLGVERQDAAIVPIPTTPWRRIARGVDHTAIIARAVARESGVPLVRALKRRHRPTQWSVPTSERRRNVAGSFSCRGLVGGLRAKRLVIVVDDVRTTGATMSEACRTLVRGMEAGKAGGAKAKEAISPIMMACTVAVARTRGQGGPGPRG
ncbi:MAG: hypothetical protein K2Y21_10555 [Phycisphaerales bacterium]|nr:hypothetical protein [Phycisphaerales bacterium]